MIPKELGDTSADEIELEDGSVGFFYTLQQLEYMKWRDFHRIKGREIQAAEENWTSINVQ